jgi:hypothetical protein
MVRFAQRISELLDADDQKPSAEAITDVHAYMVAADAAMKRAHDIAVKELGLPRELRRSRGAIE